MNTDYISEKLEKKITPKRFLHSVNVMRTAEQLAQIYGEDPAEAALAGILHDCARDLAAEEAFRLCDRFGIALDEISRLQPELIHGRLGAVLAQVEFGVECPRVVDAIRNHTLGRPGMDLLGRIIFVADYIEPARCFPGVDIIREKAFENLEQAMLLGIDSTICYIISRGGLLHPDTVDTRNWVLTQIRTAPTDPRKGG